MTERRFRHLPVVDDAWKLVGLITQRDLFRIHSPQKDNEGHVVYDKTGLDKYVLKHVMTKDPLALQPTNTLADALLIMAEKKYGCIPVVDENGILAGIITQVDILKKIQITLKDRNLYKIKGGHITSVEPSKVPRIIGKKGSMISLLKKYTKCRIFVGQNGRIWIDGEEDGINKVLQTIKKIEVESLSYGLTNKIEELLKKDSKDVH